MKHILQLYEIWPNLLLQSLLQSHQFFFRRWESLPLQQLLQLHGHEQQLAVHAYEGVRVMLAWGVGVDLVDGEKVEAEKK